MARDYKSEYMAKDYNSGIIVFGRKSFSLSEARKGDGVVFDIDPFWKFQGYNWPVRYKKKQALEVKDWCACYASNAHLVNDIAHAVLFKDEGTAVAFKITFAE